MKIPFFTILIAFISIVSSAQEKEDDVSILLIGDRTSERNIPRITDPEGTHLEQMIRQLLELETEMPALKVYNLGQGGDAAFRLMDSGRHDREIAPIESADSIFVRYGINERAKRQPVAETFPGDLRALLQHDHSLSIRSV